MLKYFVSTLFMLVCSSGFSADKKEVQDPYRYDMLSQRPDKSIEPSQASVRIKLELPEGYDQQKETLLLSGVDTLDYTMVSDTMYAILDSGLHEMRILCPLLEEVFVGPVLLPAQTNSLFRVYPVAATIKVPEVRFEYDKPVIYLYSDEPIDFSLSIDFKGALNFTYPEYDEGWTGTIDPGIGISVNGKEYDYLFWEGDYEHLPSSFDLKTGFVVEGKDVVAFLEEKLDAMGLNSREQQDFITFWGPQMVKEGRCFIHFVTDASYDDIAPIQMEPTPDSQFRLFMVWKSVSNEFETPTAQELPSADRNGLTLIEWGGARISDVLDTP